MWWLWIVSAGVMVVGAILLDWLIAGVIHWQALMVGWLMSGGNAIVALTIWNHAIGATPGAFLVWGIMVNGLRILVFISGCLVIVKLRDLLDFDSFLIAALMGYFALLIGECAYLLRQVNRRRP